ncbi:MA2A1 mannosidase, partial [Polyodon spathula]|nr:MA2A1 mannosidase [Polyodon spathula]
MKLSRQFTVFGSAIFCVVVFSLYLMLDHLHLDNTKNPKGAGGLLQKLTVWTPQRTPPTALRLPVGCRQDTPPTRSRSSDNGNQRKASIRGQLSILQEKIDHLERLLSENNEIISNIRDSVINLSESVKDGKGNPEAMNLNRGVFSELLVSPPLVIPVDAEDCQFAAKSYSKAADDVQMLDVYNILPFDNPDGGVWKQGFDISYDEHEWDNEPLQVFVVPHSHNDPGWIKTFDDYYRDQTQHILNNMVVKLHGEEQMKMIWSEISYFSKWWNSIDSQKKDAVKSFHLPAVCVCTPFWPDVTSTASLFTCGIRTGTTAPPRFRPGRVLHVKWKAGTGEMAAENWRTSSVVWTTKAGALLVGYMGTRWLSDPSRKRKKSQPKRGRWREGAGREGGEESCNNNRSNSRRKSGMMAGRPFGCGACGHTLAICPTQYEEVELMSKWGEPMHPVPSLHVHLKLIERGQLEIATGGWVMTDEASTHYFAMIDQLLEGHQWLEKNLGVKPKTGWAVDPFGHSSTMAYILKRSGFSSMLIQRVHYSVKKYFASHKTLEFFWRQNWDKSSSTDILCHMMPFYSYDVPHTCGPDPKICCQFDFKRLPGGRINCPWRVPPEAIHDGNIQQRAHMILDQYRKKSKLFKTKVVLVPLGDDFRYNEASEWDQQFQNYQKLFDYMNSHPELHVKAQFGTISDYFDALKKAAGPLLFPNVSGDFFTYADRDDHYWSGYFTSRPFYKRLDRVLESHLRAAEILYSLALANIQKWNKMSAFPSSDNYKLLTEARRNLALFQHHDAITGTGKDWVVVDYGTRLFHSIMNLKRVIIDSAHFLILKDKDDYKHNPSNLFLQMDDVQPSQDALPHKTILKLGTQPRSLVIYNPTEQDRSAVITVYVNTPRVKVLTALGQPVKVQVSAVWEETIKVSKEAFQVSFVAQLSALGLGVYQLTEGTDMNTHLADYNLYKKGGRLVLGTSEPFKLDVSQNNPINFKIENTHLQLWCSGSTGLLEKVKLKDDSKEQHVKVEFMWYGTTSNRDKSGAYLFLPDGQAKPYVTSEPPIIRVTTGPVFSEVTSTYRHFTHSLRLYNVQGVDGQSVEISNTVDIRGELNCEIVMRITSDINSKDRFYTDLNGFQIQPRRTLSTLPLQANFYPMTTMTYIQDENVRMTLHSAQSLGTASLNPGQLEVIMDRRLMQDDNRGLGQGVQDNKITANLFRILLERRVHVDEKENSQPVSYPSLLSHISSLYLNHPVVPMAVNMDFGAASLVSEFRPLASSMPCDLHVVNLRAIQSKEGVGPSDEAAFILHRKGFDCSFSTKNTGLLCSTTRGKIPVNKLFNEMKVQRITPVSLSLMHTPQGSQNNSEIQLHPMEISTFRIQLR